MTAEERILATTEVSWKAILAPLLVGGLLFGASRLPDWFRWLFAAGMIILAFGYAAQRVVITRSTLRKTYPLRLIFRNGPDVPAENISKMTCFHAGGTIHVVVAEAFLDGKKYSLSLEAVSCDIRCHAFGFAIRHNIPLICRSDDDKRLAEQIRTGQCRLDPSTGYWNIPGVN